MRSVVPLQKALLDGIEKGRTAAQIAKDCGLPVPVVEIILKDADFIKEFQDLSAKAVKASTLAPLRLAASSDAAARRVISEMLADSGDVRIRACESVLERNPSTSKKHRVELGDEEDVLEVVFHPGGEEKPGDPPSPPAEEPGETD